MNMFVWFLHRCWWLLWRVAITVVCILTIQNVIRQESGFYIEFHILLVSAVCLIVGVRVWMPAPPEKKGKKETSWGGSSSD